MAIYKSSFNKNKEKPEKEEKKLEKVKEKPVKQKKKINLSVVWLVVFCALFLICVLPKNFAKQFVLGVFGLSVYPVCLIGASLCVVKLKKRKLNLNKKYLVSLVCSVVIVWFVLHLILTSKISTDNFGNYLAQTYKAKTTAGGIVFGLISYPMIKYLTVVGAFIISAIALAISVGFVVDYLAVERYTTHSQQKTKFQFDEIEMFDFEKQKENEKTDQVDDAKRIAKKKLGLETGESTIISSSMPTYDYETNLQQSRPLSKRDYILTPLDPIIPPKKTEEVFEKPKRNNFDYQEVAPSPKLDTAEEEDDLFVDEDEMDGYKQAFETDATDTEEKQSSSFEYKNANEFEPENEIEEVDDYSNEQENEDYSNQEETNFESDNFEDDSDDDQEVEEVDIDLNQHEYVDEYAFNKDQTSLGSTVDSTVVRPSVDISKFHLPNQVKKTFNQPEEQEKPKEKKEIPPYVAPPVDLLNYLDNPVRISDEELQDNIERLEQVLEDFKVPAKVNNVQVGPAVTRYELTMPRGISVNKIAQMSDDIAMTLASNGAIRVEAPIPGKTSVGVEVPNKQVSPVSLRELVDSEEFRQRGNPLSFVLGRDINGDIIFCNLDKMPHILVAGSTGSGKSVCLNTMLLSMCYKAGPQDLRLILVDPKMVEFTTYNGLPHLLIPEVITNKNMTINALDWAIKEMERRYALFAKNHVVNIKEFNKSDVVASKQETKLPFIVVVVDELADLMLEAKREIDDRIAKIAAKARAAGIHLVLATQRPSVDVITGTVKANLPSRIAFALTNFMDSKTVLDGSGAEKLLGKGDMLFKPQDKPEAMRVQGAFVSNQEIARVVEFIKEHNQPVFDDDADRSIKNPKQEQSGSSFAGNEKDHSEFDPVLKDALRMFIQTKQASGSMISRRYSVGFNRAGRIMDQMERAGFIGPQEGSKPRQVLISLDEYKAIFGEDEN